MRVFRYYHIENQEKAGGIDVDKFAKEHILLKFTFVRHPFGRYPCTGSHAEMLNALKKYLRSTFTGWCLFTRTMSCTTTTQDST